MPSAGPEVYLVERFHVPVPLVVVEVVLPVVLKQL
jgi:hypothetical protein